MCVLVREEEGVRGVCVLVRTEEGGRGVCVHVRKEEGVRGVCGSEGSVHCMCSCEGGSMEDLCTWREEVSVWSV